MPNEIDFIVIGVTSSGKTTSSFALSETTMFPGFVAPVSSFDSTFSIVIPPVTVTVGADSAPASLITTFPIVPPETSTLSTVGATFNSEITGAFSDSPVISELIAVPFWETLIFSTFVSFTKLIEELSSLTLISFTEESVIFNSSPPLIVITNTSEQLINVIFPLATSEITITMLSTFSKTTSFVFTVNVLPPKLPLLIFLLLLILASSMQEIVDKSIFEESAFNILVKEVTSSLSSSKPSELQLIIPKVKKANKPNKNNFFIFSPKKN